MKFIHKNYTKEAVELNITAFMNLMVILVPFLLITAVFSRLTILELNLPALDAASEKQEKIDLQLQLVIYPTQYIIQDVNLGVIKSLPREQDGKTDWKVFGNTLLEIKRRFPEENSISLLFEKSIAYKTLIKVMDNVRTIDVVQIAQVETIELFPNISIGKATDLSDEDVPKEVETLVDSEDNS
jgi:biopolymer transport protein ExbD